ncbi:hypothetical protein GCM10010471_14700 [Leucobacter komagatae]
MGELFLPEDNKLIHVLAYFVPASVAIVAAFVLSVEVIFMRKKGSGYAQEPRATPDTPNAIHLLLPIAPDSPR